MKDNNYKVLGHSMKNIDLSGYMFSGKSALSDILREFSCFEVPDYDDEFELLRVPGGLCDLSMAFDNWSPTRADIAIRKFQKVTKQLARSNNNLMRHFNVGFGYNDKYDNFTELTEQFLNKIIIQKWDVRSPSELVNISRSKYFKEKICAKLTNRQFPWPQFTFHLSSSKLFDINAKIYLSNLLNENAKSKGKNGVITHNAFEPFSPHNNFRFFEQPYSIIIDRDIRDIYMGSINKSKGYNEFVSLYSRINGSFDIQTFIMRQKIMRQESDFSKKENVLRIRFEDLIFNYECSLDKIYKFLNVDSCHHIDIGKFFNPNDSIINTKTWKNADKETLKNIALIESELPEFCYLN